MSPGVTITERGNVRLIGAGNIVDLTPDEAAALANELTEAVDELAERLNSAPRTGGGQNLATDVSPRAGAVSGE